MSRLTRTGAVVLTGVCIAASLTACGRSSGGTSSSASGCDTGMTDKTLTLGASTPLSGPAASYAGLATGAKAYFDYLNKHGGVKFGDGKTRKINMTVLDDAYDPARTVTNARTLVQKDKVFAIMDVLGTSPNLAIAPFLKAQKVPDLFVQSGASEIQTLHDAGNQIAGYIPSYDFEANVLTQYLKAHKPNAKVALFYQNDDFGQNVLSAYQHEFQGTGIKLVAKQSYEVTDTSIASQMVNLAKSGADTFLDYGVGTKMTQSLQQKAQLGWKPLTLLSSGSTSAEGIMRPAGVAATKGAVSFNWLKDVTSADWSNDAGVKKFKAVAAASGGELSANDYSGSNGYTTAQLMVKALESMKGCTRDDLYDALQHLSNVTTDLALPGLKISTDPKVAYTIRSVQIMTFNGKSWKFDSAKNYSAS